MTATIKIGRSDPACKVVLHNHIVYVLEYLMLTVVRLDDTSSASGSSKGTIGSTKKPIWCFSLKLILGYAQPWSVPATYPAKIFVGASQSTAICGHQSIVLVLRYDVEEYVGADKILDVSQTRSFKLDVCESLLCRNLRTA